MATHIEWAANPDGTPGETWNPIVGCQIVSPGCRRCYAMRTAHRLGQNPAVPHYHGLTHLVNGSPVWTGEVRFHERALGKPLSVRKPTTWFVNSMSDLFAVGVRWEWIDRIWSVMALTPHHTYIILTKRPEEMRAYMADRAGKLARFMIDEYLIKAPDTLAKGRAVDLAWPVKSIGDIDDPDDVTMARWPLPNVWLGTSAERQKELDERTPHLLATDAAVRVLSIEPMLGRMRFAGTSEDGQRQWDYLTGVTGVMHRDGPDFDRGPKIDGIFLGGENASDAAPMPSDWVREVRDACAVAGTAFFFKQWGSCLPCSWDGDDGSGGIAYEIEEGCAGVDYDVMGKARVVQAHGCEFARFGHKNTGRLLDGRTHDDRPAFKHLEGNDA